MKKREPRIDPYTGDNFIPCRRNQRFASSRNRIAYHNERAAVIREEKYFIDNPLSRNHKILKELLSGRKEAMYHKQFLLGKGFSFRHVTHSEEYQGKYLHAVYGFIWMAVSDINGNPTENIKIIKLDKHG